MISGSNASLVSSLLFAVTIGGTILTLMLRTPPSSTSHTNSVPNVPVPRRTEVPNAFHLGVTITFPSQEDKDTFVELFKPLARYVEDFELGTLSYQLLQSDKNPLKVHVLERYKNKDYFLNVHKKSPQFLSFREQLQRLYDKGAKAEGESFVETDIGFI